MGVIKDGSVSGFLPSTEAFAVHYPGYPSSMSRAIETLGGTEGIVKVRSLQSNKLELHFRPEDPYSHPAFGELHPCNNLLLKISKKNSSEDQRVEVSNRTSKCPLADPINSKKKICPIESVGNGQQVRQPESESVVSTKEVEPLMPEEVEINLSADIVARVSEAYHFNGMVDYQHVLAVHADVARRKKRNWADVEPHFEKGGLMDVDQDDLMILVPPLFSPKDVPEKLALRPSAMLSLKKKQEGVAQQHWEYLTIIQIPTKVDWEKYIPQGSDQWEWQMAVSKMFDERPIWPKDSLTEHLRDSGLKFGDNMLRRLLFRVAYYFSNGPFLRFWIRKGYDPRKDPESRIYQRIDFRVPPSLRSYCDANTGNELKHRWEDICAFRVFPYKCQMSLQLFELADDYIQQEIRKPLKQTTCTCAIGWFSCHVLDNLRLRVAVRFLSVYPNTDAEIPLKSATERFEKSKRMLVYKNDVRLDEVGNQQVNKEMVRDEDKEEPNDVADDEEDEIEIDDDGELDAYEAFHLAGEDDEISPQPSSYIDGENISRNYLQELFGTFPSTEAGVGKVQDADTSDGEYQIFEHYSDGNYSNDEDY
ncbi:hypothetical protein L1049_017125 [Liquidambar formosana]|uniref:General transcription factor 3C polypeptide 5 n=1 Tax=Liquidambar formosana TaxID=63359 RepID=A0AAP0S7M3_LIQFO